MRPAIARLRHLHLLSVLLALPIAAQQEENEPPSLSALVRQLRNPKLLPDERQAVVEEMLAREQLGAKALFDHTRRLFLERSKDLDKAMSRLAKLADKEAGKLLRPDRETLAQIEELRGKARLVTDDPELNKRLIQQELDPILTELTALTLPDAEQVLAASATLQEMANANRALLLEVHAWYEANLRGMRALDTTQQGARHVDRIGELPEPPDAHSTIPATLRRAALHAALTPRDAETLLQNEQMQAEIDPEEADGILQLNKIRIALGLPAVRIDTKLCQASRDHSQDMLKLKFFAHQSPVPGKESFGQRAALCGTSASAENIAAGQATGEGAIRAWWYSPGHHRNMLGGHRRVGLGRADQLWTQMFGG